ncbi:MAG: CBS domain-containing protein, partial [Thermoproteus sp.]
EEPDVALAVKSERDVERALNMRMALSTPVDAFMSRGVISVEADEPLSRAAELMWRYNVRHLVVTKGGRLYGVVSIRDLLRPDALRSLCKP